jgi:hypothetical protein
MNPLAILQILEAVTGILANVRSVGHPDLVPLPKSVQAQIQKLVAPIMDDAEWEADHVNSGG